MNIRSSRYLLRLVIFCILIGALPVIVVGAFSYYRSAYTIQQKVNASNSKVLLQTKMRVEQVLQSVDRSLMYFVDSSYVNSAMLNSLNSEDFGTAGELTNQLNHIASYDLGVEDGCLVNISKDWILNNSGRYKLSEAENNSKYMSYISIPKTSTWVSEINKSPIDKDTGFYLDKFFDKPAVNLVKKVPINSLQPSGIAIAKIPCNYLGKLLASNNEMDNVIILNENYHLLADSNGAMAGKDFSQIAYIKKIQQFASEEGKFNTKVNEDSSSVIYIKSSYTGWTYISIISISDLTKDAKAIGWFTASICLGILIIIGFISFFGSRRMYNPIRNLFQIVVSTNKDELPLKGRDEFQYIGERISTLMSSQTKMSSQIQNQLRQLKEFFVLKLIRGEIDKKEIDQKLNFYGYTSPTRWMTLLVIQIDKLEGTRYEEKDRDLMMFAINNVVTELLETKCLLTPVVINQSQVTIIGGQQESYEKFKNFIYTEADKIKNIIGEYLELQVSIGISRTFHGFYDANCAYLEGLEALKYQIRLGYCAILFIEDVQPEKNVYTILPVRIQYALVDAVKAVDREKAIVLLHQYLEEVFKLQLNHGDYQIPLARLLTELILIIQDSGETYSILCSGQKSLFEQLFELKTTKDIENWFINAIIEPIIQIFEEKSGNQYKKIFEDVVKMIEAEYDTDLSMEKCASRMNYHPSYIRRIFLKETGMNFIDYLTQYRVYMAKKWLTETNMKVSDIAERLRYNNAQNFIRSFRKMKGITPGQYRKNMNDLIQSNKIL